MLTDQDAKQMGFVFGIGARVVRAIEAAVLSKLAAGVSVEPAYKAKPYSSLPTVVVSAQVDYYSRDQLTTAIAAARVQALEEAANPTDDQLVKGVKAMRLFVTKNSVADFKKGYVAAIRELIGDKSET